jgi:CDP-4-dehydro-6-deoxyglucose reductase
MPQPLTLSRAAKLAGVTRSQLQETLRASGLNMFEGKIAVGDLLSLYPEIDLDRDPVFERIERIKETARPKREYSDGWVPQPDVLMARLKEMQSVLVRTKAALNRGEALVEEISQRLEEIGLSAEPATRARLDALRETLTASRESPTLAADARAEIFARDNVLKMLAAKVKLQPSGHEYFVEGKESLLDAALRAGLHVDYGCSSGNCGACKCRILAGQASRLREHDYVLSAHEQEDGYVLACAWTAVTDLVIEAHEAASPAQLPVQEIRTTVQRIEHLGTDGALLHLKTPRTHSLRFMSGQSVRLTNEDGASRIYPVASCACDGRHLLFLIRRRADDDFGQSVLEEGIVGQMVRIEGPTGDFVLQEDVVAPCVLIAAGEGIAYIKSLLEHAIAIDNADWLHVYLVHEPAWGDKILNLFRSWEDALDNFQLARLPQQTDAHTLYAQLQRDHPDLNRCNLYIAGPAPLVDPLGSMLKEVGGESDANLRLLAVE